MKTADMSRDVARDSRRDRGMPIHEYKGGIESRTFTLPRRAEGGGIGRIAPSFWKDAASSHAIHPVQVMCRFIFLAAVPQGTPSKRCAIDPGQPGRGDC